MMILRFINKGLHAWCGAPLLWGSLALCVCSCIDEDLSDCGVDYNVEYRMEMTDDADATLRRELYLAEEQEALTALQPVVGAVFTPLAADLGFTFHHTDGTQAYRQSRIINSASAAFTLYLSAKPYRTLAVANAEAEPVLQGEPSPTAHSWQLTHTRRDTVDSHTRGVFTGVQDIDIPADASQSYVVPLHMRNCGCILLLDHTEAAGAQTAGYLSDMAATLQANDSTFSHADAPLVRMNRLVTNRYTALHGFCFPSQTAPVYTRAGSDSSGAYWGLRAYVTLTDGTTTENLLYVRRPLHSEELYILKGRIDAEGRITVESREVGVSVTLNWKEGGTYEPEI